MYSKGKKTQSAEAKPSLEPDSRISQMLERSVCEFETTGINMLRTLKGKVDNMQGQKGSVNRDDKSKKEPWGNTRNQRHCDRSKECL